MSKDRQRAFRELPPTAGLPLKLADFCSLSSSGRFAAALADFLEVSEVQLVPSGTAGLYIAFETLKRLSQRRTVILSGFTCPLVAIAAAKAGLKILLCDTAKDGFEFDLDSLRELCNEDTLCLVVAHLGGLPADVSSVLEIAREFGAFLIEDTAQSLGARDTRRMVGTAGDIGIFSLACGKGLSLYDGGFLWSGDPKIRAELRRVILELVPKRVWMNLLRYFQMLGYAAFYRPAGLNFVYGNELRDWLAKGDLIKAVGDYFEPEIPLYRFEDLRLGVGLSALSRLPEFVRQNRERALARIESLKKSRMNVLTEKIDTQGSWPFFMLLAENSRTRDAVLNKLWGAGLGVTRLFIHALGDYEYLREIIQPAVLPNARDFAARSFTVTNSFWLSELEFAKILAVLEAETVDSAVVHS